LKFSFTARLISSLSRSSSALPSIHRGFGPYPWQSICRLVHCKQAACDASHLTCLILHVQQQAASLELFIVKKVDCGCCGLGRMGLTWQVNSEPEVPTSPPPSRSEVPMPLTFALQFSLRMRPQNSRKRLIVCSENWSTSQATGYRGRQPLRFELRTSRKKGRAVACYSTLIWHKYATRL
jgi:hypothetical protein